MRKILQNLIIKIFFSMGRNINLTSTAILPKEYDCDSVGKIIIYLMPMGEHTQCRAR